MVNVSLSLPCFLNENLTFETLPDRRPDWPTNLASCLTYRYNTVNHSPTDRIFHWRAARRREHRPDIGILLVGAVRMYDSEMTVCLRVLYSVAVRRLTPVLASTGHGVSQLDNPRPVVYRSRSPCVSVECCCWRSCRAIVPSPMWRSLPRVDWCSYRVSLLFPAPVSDW